ncbi:MAG: hypothetical protein ACP5HU_06185 [Phycisphaerae bacterium]
MTKRQIIDQILQVNSTADPGFLARFESDELDAYLRHLRQARTPRLAGDPHRFDHYFHNIPAVSYQSAARQTVAVAEPPERGYEQVSPVESGISSEDMSHYDEGLYVSQDSGALYDVPTPDAADSHEETPAVSEDDLDLSYVPAGRDEQSDPETEKKQSDSSFADVEEDAEAWLF